LGCQLDVQRKTSIEFLDRPTSVRAEESGDSLTSRGYHITPFIHTARINTDTCHPHKHNTILSNGITSLFKRIHFFTALRRLITRSLVSSIPFHAPRCMQFLRFLVRYQPCYIRFLPYMGFLLGIRCPRRSTDKSRWVLGHPRRHSRDSPPRSGSPATKMTCPTSTSLLLIESECRVEARRALGNMRTPISLANNIDSALDIQDRFLETQIQT
jgi:hypothetical protein